MDHFIHLDVLIQQEASVSLARFHVAITDRIAAIIDPISKMEGLQTLTVWKGKAVDIGNTFAEECVTEEDKLVVIGVPGKQEPIQKIKFFRRFRDFR